MAAESGPVSRPGLAAPTREAAPRRFALTPLVALGYAALAAVFWGTFLFERGLHADTIYIELSQARPGLDGFLYPYDSTRRFMSVPFHLAYLLSSGSYLSLHLVYGVLVWATGFLAYALVRAYAPRATTIAVCAGAIALTFGADPYSNLVALIMVRQAVVAIALALLLLRVGWQRRNPWVFVAIPLAQGLAMWTYEAGFLLLVAAPLTLYRRHEPSARLVRWAAAWYAVPALFVATLLERYIVAGAASYQSQQLTGDLSPLVVGSKLATLMNRGLNVWTWPTMWTNWVSQCATELHRLVMTPIAVGLVVFLALAFGAIVIARRQATTTPGAILGLLVGGLVFQALAYGLYLPLAGDAAQLFRTQFFSAIPAAVAIAAAAFLIDHLIRGRSIVGTVLCATVVGVGLYSGLMSQLEQSARWRPYRDVMRAIVDAAPRLRDKTMVVLVDATNGYFHTLCDGGAANPAFEDTMWFNSGLQVLYPRTTLMGMFWREDRSTSPTFQIEFDETGAHVTKPAVSVEASDFGYDEMVVFAQDRSRGAVLLTEFPVSKIPGSRPNTLYNPRARILPGPAPPETLGKLAY